jgi:uncharacterized protein YjiS (DUF1127 family)
MEDLFENSTIQHDGTLSASSHRERMHPMTRTWISIFDTVASWRERARQRRALADLPDFILRDIGVSRVDARREGEKPFWRA